MHKKDVVIFEVFSCAVNGIDIIRLVVKRVLNEGEAQRQLQRAAVIHKHVVKEAGGHYHLGNANLCQLTKLTAQDCLCRRNLRHTFGVLVGEYSHAFTYAGI